TAVTAYSSKPDNPADADDTFSPATQSVDITVQQPVVYSLSFSAQPPRYVLESTPFCPVVSVSPAVAGVPVTIAGIPTPSGGTAPDLGGTLKETTGSSGVAAFGTVGSSGTCASGLAVSNAGTFELQASTTDPSNGPATSSQFTVLPGYYTLCSGSCSMSNTSTATGVTSTVDASGSGTFYLGTSFGLGSGGLTRSTCGTDEIPSPFDPLATFTAGTTGSVSGTVTLNFPQPMVHSQPNDGRPHMQVCASATEDFQTASGTSAEVGLVADCVDGTYPYTPSSHLLGICVLSRAKGSLGHETITLKVSDLGDPDFW
ncbi:MAG: hypothetical protein ACRDYY_00140, partial [Acidimicrobiales bacterium]